MFYDLNVAVDPAQREDAARTCARLGFDVIAFNTTVNVRKLGAEHMPPPLPDLSKATLPHDAGALRVSDGHARGRSCIRVLNRITLVVDDPAQLATLGSPVLGNFDLVAVAPGSEKLFQQCLQFDFDIIALRFASKQQFYLKRPQLHVAAEKGIVFEISYAAALEDAQSRRFLIGNAVSVSRVTLGKQTILSSGAKHPMQLRGPHDVINLGHVFGIDNERSRQAVCGASEAAVAHGDVRKNTHKGIIRKVDKVPLPFPEKDTALQLS